MKNNTSPRLPDDPALMENNDVSTEQWIPWTNCLYKLWFWVHRLFENPFKERKPELNLLDQVNILVNEGNNLEKNSGVCEEYIKLHRIVENTKARKRLEKWITRLISSYLIVVLSILVLCSIPSYKILSFNTSVMITILSTTTVNIVALGLILVRGLFHENESEDIAKENPAT